MGKIAGIGLADAWILVEAWFLLGLVDLGLRWLPYGTVRKLLDRRFLRPSPADPELPSVERVRRLVDAAANHHLVKMTCLRRALVLQRVLDGRGVKSRLRLGVRQEGESLTAHAWLECGDSVVGDLPADFAVLESSGKRLDPGGERPSLP